MTTPRACGTKPCGHRERASARAPRKLARPTRAPTRSAPQRFAPRKFADRRSASRSTASLRSASRRLQRRRDAAERSAPLRLDSARLDAWRSTPVRSVWARFADARFAYDSRTSGCLSNDDSKTAGRDLRRRMSSRTSLLSMGLRDFVGRLTSRASAAPRSGGRLQALVSLLAHACCWTDRG